MADTKVSLMTDSGVPAEDDLLYLVDVSSADPKERRLTIANLATAVKPDSEFVGGEGGSGEFVLLLAQTAGVGTPVELLDKDGNPIDILKYPGDIVALTFSALFVAMSETGDAGGYKVEGVAKHYSGDSALVGPTFDTTLGEDEDWSVVATVDDATDTLRFHYTGTLADGCHIAGHVHLIYLVAE